MTRAIDPTKPVDGVPAVEVDLRDNLHSANDEIEVLPTGKSDLDRRVPADVTDASALAGESPVESGAIVPAVVISAENATDPDALITVDGGAMWHGSHAGRDLS